MCNNCPTQDFVHLHAHTHYSVQDAYGSPKQYATKARKMGFPAAAITDHGRMGGVVEFVDAARAPKDDLPALKPLIGCEVYTCADMTVKENITTEDGKKRRPKHNHLGLIAKNATGYRNLLQIASIGAEEGFYYDPRVDWSVIEKHSEGLIAFTGCLASEVNQALLRGEEQEAENIMRRFKDLFGDDYYCELQYHGIEEQKANLPKLTALARKLDIPIVATNDVHYMEPDDWRIHDILIQMRTLSENRDPKAKNGKKEAYGSHQFWLKTRAEMEKIFGAKPEALDNTLAVAEKVEDFLKLDVPHLLPSVNIPLNDPQFRAFKEERLPHHQPNEAYLAYLAFKGLKELGLDQSKRYVTRLKSELQQIWYMGVTDYFLIQHEMVEFMKGADIYYGIRGSGVGSLVNYCLRVCAVDPIQWNLMFERFLNPGRGTQYKIDYAAYPAKQWLGENGKVSQQAAEKRLRQLAKEWIDEGKVEAHHQPEIAKEIWVLANQGLAAYVCDLADKGVTSPHNDSQLWSAYMLGITDEKPDQGLIVSKVATLPDVDTDIDDSRRPEVIQWARGRFGDDRVKMIGTWGTYGAKAAIVGSLKTSDKFTKRWGEATHQMAQKVSGAIPKRPGITIDEALEESEEFAQWAARYPDEVEIAKRLVGTISNLGVHAGGVLVSSEPINLHSPVENSKGTFCSAFDMKAVERVGLVKYDYLGLATYQMVARAIKLIEKRRGVKIDPAQIPLDDKKVFKLYAAGKTASVFQFASRGMQDALKLVQASNVEDLIAVAALYRPGPMQYIEDYARGKHDPESVHYSHPLMRKHLEVTYGIMVYQEQAMFLARDMAELDWNEVDKLRKAISKKSGKDFEDACNLFRTRALARGIEAKVVDEVLHLMEKFGGYAFNRSHACSYAILSYWTAYLRVHYPAEWLAACIQVDHDDEDKMALYRRECRGENITVKPPSVNDSGMEVTVNEKGEICLPLTAIKGVGVLAEVVVANQPFVDLRDMVNRARPNKSIVKALAEGHALDCLSDIQAIGGAAEDNVEEIVELFDQYVADRTAEEKRKEREAKMRYKTQGLLDLDDSPPSTPARAAKETKRTPGRIRKNVLNAKNIFEDTDW